MCEPFVDARGAFLNAFRAQEESFLGSWGARGISQVNISRSDSVGTIRGLHLQIPPHSEAKLVRCLKAGFGTWQSTCELIRPPVASGTGELNPNEAMPCWFPRVCPWLSGFGARQRAALSTFWHLGSGGRIGRALGRPPVGNYLALAAKRVK